VPQPFGGDRSGDRCRRVGLTAVNLRLTTFPITPSNSERLTGGLKGGPGQRAMALLLVGFDSSPVLTVDQVAEHPNGLVHCPLQDQTGPGRKPRSSCCAGAASLPAAP